VKEKISDSRASDRSSELKNVSLKLGEVNQDIEHIRELHHMSHKYSLDSEYRREGDLAASSSGSE
jgi:hypothetical protein